MRKQTKRQRLISELASIQKVREERPPWFQASDFKRLDQAWAAKSAELVAMEVRNHRRKLQW